MKRYRLSRCFQGVVSRLLVSFIIINLLFLAMPAKILSLAAARDQSGMV